MTDIDYDKLNPGIRETVRLLRSWGYDTCDSGDGVTREAECDRGFPYVSIIVPRFHDIRKFTDKLACRLWDYGVDVRPQGQGPCVQLTYDPANRVAIVEVMDLDDEGLKVG